MNDRKWSSGHRAAHLPRGWVSGDVGEGRVGVWGVWHVLSRFPEHRKPVAVSHLPRRAAAKVSAARPGEQRPQLSTSAPFTPAKDAARSCTQPSTEAETGRPMEQPETER